MGDKTTTTHKLGFIKVCSMPRRAMAFDIAMKKCNVIPSILPAQLTEEALYVMLIFDIDYKQRWPTDDIIN